MADNNLLPADKKWVYLYDSSDTAHSYKGKLMVDKDDPLMPGQTDAEVPADDKRYYFNDATKQWVDTLVLTYEIKSDKRLGAITRHPAGYVLQANETFTKPKDGLYDPQWNGSDWVGISAEEYYKQHPVEPAKPSAQQTVMAGLLKDVATIKTDSKSQDALNANVMKQLADQKVAQAKVNATILKQLAEIKTANKATA